MQFFSPFFFIKNENMIFFWRNSAICNFKHKSIFLYKIKKFFLFLKRLYLIPEKCLIYKFPFKNIKFNWKLIEVAFGKK
jgi:hypothetical protein